MRGMDRIWVQYRFRTTRFQDDEAGCVGLTLSVEEDDAPPVEVTRVIYWDASGHWYLEPVCREVPLEVIVELIAEANSFGIYSLCPRREAGG